MAQDNLSTSHSTSSPLQVFVYWLIVGLPLCWGVYKTVQKSVPLFKQPDAAAVAPATPAPATPPALSSPTPA